MAALPSKNRRHIPKIPSKVGAFSVKPKLAPAAMAKATPKLSETQSSVSSANSGQHTENACKGNGVAGEKRPLAKPSQRFSKAPDTHSEVAPKKQKTVYMPTHIAKPTLPPKAAHPSKPPSDPFLAGLGL